MARKSIKVMRTAFEEGRTEVYREFMLDQCGGLDAAWDSAVRLVKSMNSKGRESERFWIKYK